jgi:hypothetical protein
MPKGVENPCPVADFPHFGGIFALPPPAGPIRPSLVIEPPQALVAQLDRASDFDSEGREFESLRARQHLCLKIKGFSQFRFRSFLQIRCCVLYLINPFDINLSRLVRFSRLACAARMWRRSIFESVTAITANDPLPPSLMTWTMRMVPSSHNRR